MSGVKHSCNFKDSGHWKSGEPFTVNECMNSMRCSRTRALQVLGDMVRNNEASKIHDDCYRRRAHGDEIAKKDWRINIKLHEELAEL